VTDVAVHVALETPAAQYKPPVWKASRNAEVEPDAQRAWRLNFTDPSGVRTVVEFAPISKPSRTARRANSLGVISLVLRICEVEALCCKGRSIHQLRATDHNQNGDALAAAARSERVFGDPTGTYCTQLQDLQANFADWST